MLTAAALLLHLAARATALTTDGQSAALKQYTSRGHVLGFDSRGYYVSNGTYALRVTFDDGAAVAPSSGDAAGAAADQQKAAALGRVTYSGVWPGIGVTYDAPGSGIARSTWTLEPGADPAQIRLRYNRPVKLTEAGGNVYNGAPPATDTCAPTDRLVWTNVSGGGLFQADYDCTNWTNETGSNDSVLWGDSSVSDPTWTGGCNGSGIDLCSKHASLYCFEQ